jgi:hypothetical protein
LLKFKKILNDFKNPKKNQPGVPLPSPYALRHKILVKNKIEQLATGGTTVTTVAKRSTLEQQQQQTTTPPPSSNGGTSTVQVGFQSYFCKKNKNNKKYK